MSEVEMISRNLAVKQHAFFHAAKGEGYSKAVLSIETGIPASTLDSYCTTGSRKPAIMPLDNFVKLISATRKHPHLASLLIEDSGCVIASTDPQATEWLALGERMCAAGAKIFRYQASDNHIDHREDADLCAEMIEIVSEGHAMLGRRP